MLDLISAFLPSQHYISQTVILELMPF